MRRWNDSALWYTTNALVVIGFGFRWFFFGSLPNDGNRIVIEHLPNRPNSFSTTSKIDLKIKFNSRIWPFALTSGRFPMRIRFENDSTLKSTDASCTGAPFAPLSSWCGDSFNELVVDFWRVSVGRILLSFAASRNELRPNGSSSSGPTLTERVDVYEQTNQQLPLCRDASSHHFALLLPSVLPLWDDHR